MNRLMLLLLVFLCIPHPEILGQGEIDSQDKVFYRDERTYGIQLATTGIGFNFSYAKRYNARKKTLYLFDLVEIKHPKEKKISSQAALPNLIYGKTNRFYNIRAGVGIQNELFKKTDLGSISIRQMISGGLNIGLLKPMYYHLENFSTGQRNIGRLDIDKFDAHNIVKKEPFFTGMLETKLRPGAFLKYSYVFEYGEFDKVFNAVEGGVTLDLYPKKVPIMVGDRNSFFFLSLFVAYRFGTIIDAQFKQKRNKIDKILTE